VFNKVDYLTQDGYLDRSEFYLLYCERHEVFNDYLLENLFDMMLYNDDDTEIDIEEVRQLFSDKKILDEEEFGDDDELDRCSEEKNTIFVNSYIDNDINEKLPGKSTIDKQQFLMIVKSITGLDNSH